MIPAVAEESGDNPARHHMCLCPVGHNTYQIPIVAEESVIGGPLSVNVPRRY